MTTEKKDEIRPGRVYIPAIDNWVELNSWQLKSYYYGVSIPQDMEADMTIGLFEGHIGDKEWTNFTRPNMIPKWHRSLIYKVSLAVGQTADVKIVDVFRALQLGVLTIKVRGQEPLISEPLSFFPVTIYGEMAERKDDLSTRVALLSSESGGLDQETARPILNAISKMALPIDLDDSVIIDGDLDVRKELYGTPPFVLYVILHSITTMPIK